MPELTAAAGGTACPQAVLPAIAQDDCVGCNRCITACPPLCLTLIWDFATLTSPDTCTGCARCAEACRYGVITMQRSPLPP